MPTAVLPFSSIFSRISKRFTFEPKVKEKIPSVWVQDQLKQSTDASSSIEAKTLNIIRKVNGKLRKIDPHLIGEKRFDTNDFFLIRIIKVIICIFRAQFYSSNTDKWNDRLLWLQGHIIDYGNAVDQNDLPKVQVLLTEFPDLINLNLKRDSRTPLENALRKEYYPLFNFLLTRPNIQSSMLNTQDSNGDTLLHLACSQSNDEIIELLYSIAPQLTTVKNKKGQLPCHILLEKRLNEKNVEAYILKFINLIPPFSTLEDQKDLKGYYPIHYLIRANLFSYAKLVEVCTHPVIAERLVFEKRDDFIFSLYIFLMRKDKNYKVPYEIILVIFEELNFKLLAFSDKFNQALESGLGFNELVIQDYVNLVGFYSLLTHQYSETIIFDQTVIDRFVRILSFYLIHYSDFDNAITNYLKPKERQLLVTSENSNDEVQMTLTTLHDYKVKLQELITLFTFLQTFFTKKQKKLNLHKVIDSFKKFKISNPNDTLTTVRRNTTTLLQTLEELIQLGQNKLAKKQREETSFDQLLHDEDTVDIYEILEHIRNHENLQIPFTQAYPIIFKIPKHQLHKLYFHTFGIQEVQDLRTFGMTFEVKILAKDRALTQREQFLNALRQKAETLKQLPLFVQQKLLEDLEQKKFKSLEEELKDITPDKIDESVIKRLKEHEIAMNISLFAAFINQDLTALRDYVENYQLDAQNEGQSFSLVDLQKQHALSIADMYQLQKALEQKKFKQGKEEVK